VHPADRRVRAIAGWVLVAVCAVAVVLAWQPAWAQNAVLAQADEVERGDATRGGELYQRWCAVCHGTDGGGTYAGPPLLGTSLAYNDLTMRTGRMPLADPNQGVRSREFTDTEREDTLAYLAEALGLDGTIEEPGPGDPAAGQDIYVNHCAQCHGATGAGGIAGDGTLVPATRGLDPLTIAQATRIGPFQMPAFDETAITEDQLDDLVAYTAPPATGLLGFAEMESRVVAVLFALGLGALLVWFCVWVGRPVPAPDVEEDHRL
jgi:ubiquinol-cytochrome c reductase cytochrome c subunit